MFVLINYKHIDYFISVVVDDTRPGANGPSAPGGGNGNGNGNGSGTTAEPRSNAIKLSTGVISLLVAAIMIIM